MSKLAKGLLGAFVLAACAVGGDDSSAPMPSGPAGEELAVIAPAALPDGMGGRLQRTCTARLPAELELFGSRGAPATMNGPHRVIPASTAPLPVIGGAIAIGNAKAAGPTIPAMKLAKVASGANVLVSSDGSMEVATTLRGSTPVEAKSSDGLVVYPRGHRDGDIVVRPRADGAEDWLLLGHAPSEGIEYDVALKKGVAAVRLVANTVEFLDSGGVPRLRMAPPSLVDDECRMVDVQVKVTGCVVDETPEQPQRKPHPAPGAASCRVALAWESAEVRYPIALDPTWSSTASMAVDRAFHTATRLGSPERVLVVGGARVPGTSQTGSTEVYDVASGTWSAAPSAGSRMAHTATLFSDGSVLIAGGFRNTAPTTSVQLFSTGTWTTMASLPTGRWGQSAVLSDSDTVLIAGGFTSSGTTSGSTGTTTRYRRSTNTYLTSPTFSPSRAWHGAVAAPGGIYLIGGETITTTPSTNTPVSSVVRYNVLQNTFSTSTSLPFAMTKVVATAVAGAHGTAKILAAGDQGTAVIEAPSMSSWSWLPSIAASFSRFASRSTGPVLVGGDDSFNGPIAETMFFDNPSVGLSGPSLITARWAHTATGLDDDRVLVAGGYVASGDTTADVEILGTTSCTTVADCDDANPCTVDTCSSGGWCKNVAKDPTDSCDDGNLCNGVSTCSDTAQCLQTTPPVAVDVCGSCNPTTGAVGIKPAGASCARPASACRSPGVCNGSSAAESSCITAAAPDGTSCGNADVCDPAGVQVCISGGCQARPGSITLQPPSDPCSATTCDPSLGIVRTRTCGLQDPDAATPIDPSVATSFDASTAFLTAPGSTTGQAGVTVDPARRAVIRGRVSALDASGVGTTPSVAITVKGHPEYGTVTSGDHGEYAIVVDGGGDLVVHFARAGYITAERHAKTTWHEYTVTAA